MCHDSHSWERAILGPGGTICRKTRQAYSGYVFGNRQMVHFLGGAAFTDILLGCLQVSQSGIKLAARREANVRGDNSAKKVQASSAVEFEIHSNSNRPSRECRRFCPLGASVENAVSRIGSHYRGQSSIHTGHDANEYSSDGWHSCRPPPHPRGRPGRRGIKGPPHQGGPTPSVFFPFFLPHRHPRTRLGRRAVLPSKAKLNRMAY